MEEDYPSKVTAAVIVMKVPDILLQEFLVQSSMEDHNIWGMDSQYLSQLFVPKTNNTIPDFIALAMKS